MVPPLAARVVLYDVPTMPVGSDVVVMVIWAAMVSVYGCWAVCPVASFTCTVMEKLPLAVGVPEMVPVPEPSVKPPGNEPAVMLQVYGVLPPEAFNVAL